MTSTEPIEAAVVDDADESPGEAVSGELVAAAPREEGRSATAANAAIVAASEAALQMPGIPGRDEFLALAMQARVLSMSGAAPKAVRNNPHLAFHVAMVGRDLGISPSAALELVDVIDGGTDSSTGEKNYRLSLSPQLINGQIRRLGLGSIVPVIKAEKRCVAVAMGPDGFYDPRCKPLWPDHHAECLCRVETFIGESEFTWEDARMAGLVGQGCEPGNHTNACKDRNTKGGCNQGYRTYPKRMLWWRAAGFLADDVFPEASLGLYTPEALGAIVDEEGRPLDPGEVELPAGYEPKAVGTGRGDAPPKEQAPPAERESLEDLAIRIEALPDEQRTMLKERWMDSNRLKKYRVESLPAAELTLAASMVKGFETIAKRAGWDPDAARAEVEARRAAAEPAAESPQEGRAEPDGTEDQESPGEPQGDAAGGASEDAGSDDPAPEHVEPDPEVAAWVREVASEADPQLVETTAAEVKALHHATVNRELTERGWPPEGQHIDTRRMVLAACRINEVLHPEQCIHIGCDDPRDEASGEPVELCAGHTPF